jgi:hypothetical protein
VSGASYVLWYIEGGNSGDPDTGTRSRLDNGHLRAQQDVFPPESELVRGESDATATDPAAHRDTPTRHIGRCHLRQDAVSAAPPAPTRPTNREIRSQRPCLQLLGTED